MLHRNKDRIFSLLLISILVISSCSLKYTPRTAEEFSREISRLEALARENPDPSVRTKLHLQLARLYIDYQNPQRDYLKGCREFAAYLSLVPGDRKNDEIQNWVSALEELEKSEKEVAGLRGKMESLRSENTGTKVVLSLQLKKNKELQNRLETLEKTNRSLIEANRGLKESNEKMKETIEKLNILDRQMEEKRRSIR